MIAAPAPVTARAALPANASHPGRHATMQDSPFLRFDGVTIRLGGREILSPTSFDVTRGEFVCIVGPSGCGKTTLLRAASGLVRASEGEVRRNGVKMTEPSREVAFVFQDYGRALLPWRTVEGNVSLALRRPACRLRSARTASPTYWERSASRSTRTSFRCSCRAACSNVRRLRAASRRSLSS